MSNMKSERVISIQNLTKTFVLGEHLNLGKNLLQFVGKKSHNTIEKKLSQTLKQQENIKQENKLYALSDINLEIDQGETVGILGTNGAGKSTLLKIIVGHMSPSEGAIKTQGRIIPLLGLSSGFNAELTGLENIYINAAIFGLSRKKANNLVQSISDFSEIGAFFNTPVKRYSKGMKARLGISIAVSLDPKILIVDEVLAVGDLKFRAKCMAKMSELCQQGMTLLFVSHNPSRIRILCDRAIILRDGKLVADGKTEPILKKYIAEDLGDEINIGDLEDDIADSNTDLIDDDPKSSVFWEQPNAPGDDILSIISLRALSLCGKERHKFTSCESFQIEVTYVVKKGGRVLRPQIQMRDITGKEWIFTSIEYDDHWSKQERPVGTYKTRATIPANLLNQGFCRFGASVYSHNPLIKHAMTRYATVNIEITSSGLISSAQSDYPNKLVGYLAPKLEWQTTQL